MDAPRTGLDGITEDLARQRKVVAPRSPPYGRALGLLPRVLEGKAGRYVEAAWGKRRFVAWYDRPLLILAAIRNDALLEGESHPLWRAFAAPDADAGVVTAEALEESLEGWRERVFDALAHRGVQTNETSRAVAWLWPAFLAGASARGRPVALVDLGASAGLNLVADDLPPIWTAEDGAQLEVARDVHAVSRVGLDADPLDATRPEDAAWLRACIWPGEHDRLERLEAGLAAFRAARTRPDAPVLVPIHARDMPTRLAVLSAAEPSALVIAFQTIMSGYLHAGDREEYETGMCNWVRTHPVGSAVWVELEPAPEGSGPEGLPAWMRAHVRGVSGELETLELARCAYHPRRIARNAGEVDALRALLTPGAVAELTARV